MANYGYGWYTQDGWYTPGPGRPEDYYDQRIGNIFNIPSIFRITFCFFVNHLSQETMPRL